MKEVVLKGQPLLLLNLPAADFGLLQKHRNTEENMYFFCIIQCFCASVAINICEANKKIRVNLSTEPVEVSVAKKTAKQFQI